MNRPVAVLCALLAGGSVVARAQDALAAAALEDRLAAGEALTLVDVRPFEAFRAGSLPNALSMSAVEAAQRPLRGLVVFFDCGTGPNLARESLERYRALRGSAADAVWLRGGHAGWRQAQRPTNEPGGLQPVLPRYVSYQNLLGRMADDRDGIVLVDLRPEAAPPAPQPAGGPPRATAAALGDAEAPLDLSAEFPGFGITRAVPSAPAATPAGRGGFVAAAADDPADGPLYVLIDRGDGAAEAAAQRLRREGLLRVAILAGGEPLIRRRGEPGLIRRGPGIGLAGDPRPGARTMDEMVEEDLR